MTKKKVKAEVVVDQEKVDEALRKAKKADMVI